MERPLKIVVVGELDCGKSTLIGRLLCDTDSLSKEAMQGLKETSERLGRKAEFAYLVDSFWEERQDRLTIDTTQAFLKTKKRGYLLIDVPGHKELLKNMLTGTSYVDVAILLVDAQKGVEEQTRRHAYILKFLGIDVPIVAINKMDLVKYNEGVFEKTKEEVVELFKKIETRPMCIIPISAAEGENLVGESRKMPWHKGPFLADVLDTIVKGEGAYYFRLPVQDVYEIEGERVVVGMIVSGSVSKADIVRVAPSGIELRIKAIKVFGGIKPAVESKESIGLVFDGQQRLNRGEVVYKGRPPKATARIKAKIFCIHPMRVEEEILFRCASQEVAARILKINERIDTATLKVRRNVGALQPTDAAEVLIATARPVVVEGFQDLAWMGRFILQKGNRFYAVGIIHGF